MIRRNSVNWQGDEAVTAIRAGQGLLVGLLRCGHCGRKLHVRYWGGRGTNARYLCKGDYDDGGQYCIAFGGGGVHRRLGQEVLNVISPLRMQASLRALEELSAGDLVERVALSTKLEQLDYEARKAFRAIRCSRREESPRCRRTGTPVERKAGRHPVGHATPFNAE